MNDPNQGQNQGNPKLHLCKHHRCYQHLLKLNQRHHSQLHLCCHHLHHQRHRWHHHSLWLPGATTTFWTGQIQPTKQYYKATSPLDSTEKFDGQPNKIRLFLAHVEDRAQQFNWQSILTIPVGLPPTSYNLVHNYGQKSLQDVQAKALTYVRMQGREAQESYMLYNFLIESLTDSFKAQVLLYEQDYTITPMGGQPVMKDRLTLLKRLIMLTYIDNQATTAHIRETLIDMTYQLTNLQGDITAFNDWVREQKFAS